MVSTSKIWIGFEFGLPENQNRVAGKLDVKSKPECKTNDQNRSETASIVNESGSNENETDIDIYETNSKEDQTELDQSEYAMDE